MKKSLISFLAVVPMLVLSTAWGADETGIASYYADSLHGNPTASGEPYDRNEMTAAHRTLAFGTMVRVTNIQNGKSAVVRINDRGPHAENRIIDLSSAAAEALGMMDAGEANVRIEVIDE